MLVYSLCCSLLEDKIGGVYGLELRIRHARYHQGGSMLLIGSRGYLS
jgi:hypothetical protein